MCQTHYIIIGGSVHQLNHTFHRSANHHVRSHHQRCIVVISRWCYIFHIPEEDKKMINYHILPPSGISAN